MLLSKIFRKRSVLLLVLIIVVRTLNRQRIVAQSQCRRKPLEPTDCERVKESTIVETSKGKIRGFIATSPEGIKLKNFRGIPYAAPPTGRRRFRHPVDCHSWKPEILNCCRFGYRSVQNPNFGTEVPLIPTGRLVLGMLFRYFFGWGNNRNPLDPQPLDPNQSENCLTLNICAPAKQNSPLPVVCFFHGGGFELGHSSEELYSCPWGTAIAEKEVVYVSVNYRLGVFGYLKVEDGDYNNGLADQIKALEWINREISHFGGDSDKVTIMGHSAGAFSCGAILSCPKAHNLFHRAILMSGAATNALSKLENEKVGMALADALKIKELSVNSLSAFDASQILAAQLRISQIVGPLPFQPTVDFDLLPDFPCRSLMHGKTKDVDLLIGCTKEEAKLFHNLLLVSPFSRWSMIKLITPFVAMLGLHADVSECQELAEKLAQAYIDWYVQGQNKDVLTRSDFTELFFKFMSEFLFDAPATLLCEAHASMKQEGKRTYRYRFDYRGPMGAIHGIELPFLFGTYHKWDRSWIVRRFLGEDLSHPKYQMLSESVLTAWTNFIRAGDPNSAEFGKLVWPEFTHERRETFIFDLEKNGVKIATGGTHRDDDAAFEIMVRHRSQSDCAFGVFRD